jgi:Uma2 family endonuclease
MEHGSVREGIRPLRREEFERLVTAGDFADERVELIEGEIHEMSPQSPEHSHVIRRLIKLVGLAVGDRAEVQSGQPLAMGALSLPEPDFALVPVEDHQHRHPSSAYFVAEVTRSAESRAKDLRQLPGVYARGGVGEYWVVDLVRGRLVVHRSPEGDGYGEIRTLAPDERVALLAFPDVALKVADLLPV